MIKESIKRKVRKSYGRIAAQNTSCCAPGASCCGSAAPVNVSKNLGYAESDLKGIPEEANMGLGCGNPVAFATLKKGETVLDLGSGAGIDCFLAASKVGRTGKVIGVDMTSEMIDRARKNISKSKYRNIEFRLGEIENLPIADNSVNAVISNCVINLVPNKGKAFREIFRVLKSGGRMLISDIVLKKSLPPNIRKSVNAYIGCVSGAVLRKKYLESIKKAGFRNVKVMGETEFPTDYLSNDSTVKTIAENFNIKKNTLSNLAGAIISVKVYAEKK